MKLGPVLGLLAIVFAAGLALGLYLGDRSTTSGAAKSAGTVRADGFINDEARDRVEQNMIYTKRIKELEDELAKQKSAGSSEMTDRLQYLKEYPGRIMMWSTVSRDLNIEDGLAAFLKITPSEKSALEGHLAQLRDKLKNELEPKVTMTKQTPTQVTFEIPVIPETANLRQQMHDLLSADLGPDRADAFFALSESQLKNEFYYLGALPVDVEILQGRPGDNMPYNLQVTTKSGGGGGPFDGNLPPAFKGLIPFEPTPAH